MFIINKGTPNRGSKRKLEEADIDADMECAGADMADLGADGKLKMVDGKAIYGDAYMHPRTHKKSRRAKL